MKKFELDFEILKQTQPTIKRRIDAVNSVENQYNSLRRNIDLKIQNRCNVDEQLRTAGNHLVDAMSQLHLLDRFVINSIGEYESLENELKGKAIKLVTGSNPVTKEEVGKVARSALIAVSGVLADPHDWLLRKGLQFFLEARDGKTYIKIKKWTWDPRTFFLRQMDPGEWENVRKRLFEGLLPRRHTFRKHDIEALMKDGIALYNNETKGKITFNINKFSSDVFPELREALDDYLGKGIVQRASTAFAGAINPLKDLDPRGWFGKGVTNWDRIAKVPGIVGLYFDVSGNFDTIRNENGNVDFAGASSEQKKKFIVDTSVDVMAGSAAMAAGMAIGSLFMPPLGTVAGAVIGGGIHLLANLKILGEEPKKSVVDVTKDMANNIADGLVDGFRKLDKIIW